MRALLCPCPVSLPAATCAALCSFVQHFISDHKSNCWPPVKTPNCLPRTEGFCAAFDYTLQKQHCQAISADAKCLQNTGEKSLTEAPDC
eukprot:scaffold232727_cov21-Tisochrysis_lutea.AAC.1